MFLVYITAPALTNDKFSRLGNFPFLLTSPSSSSQLLAVAFILYLSILFPYSIPRIKWSCWCLQPVPYSFAFIFIYCLQFSSQLNASWVRASHKQEQYGSRKRRSLYRSDDHNSLCPQRADEAPWVPRRFQYPPQSHCSWLQVRLLRRQQGLSLSLSLCLCIFCKKLKFAHVAAKTAFDSNTWEIDAVLI